VASQGQWAGRLLAWCGFVLMSGYGIVMLMPIFWMVSTSLKPLDQVFGLPATWIPRAPRWENFANAWTRFAFGRYFLNSLLVSGTVTVMNVLLAGLAGYGLAKYRFLGRRALFIAVLSTLMLPVEVMMVPTFLVVRDLGWLNSYQGLIVPVLADGFSVFLMRQFMLQLPDSVIEAARIDGASEAGIFFRIAMPLAWPAAATLAVFTWRETWDSFVWPFIVVSDDSLRTVPLGLQRFQEEYVTTYNEVMAISIIAMIPLFLLFVLWQRALIRGVALSGLRE
jgi:ABC-type glycerol-3-phosphate transport system permease component